MKNKNRQTEIESAYAEGKTHALNQGKRHSCPYSWNPRPWYHKDITRAWLKGYDSVKSRKEDNDGR